MEFVAGGRPGHGRRSKLDIVGDVLRVVSEGAEKPTNIMFKANLTWPLALAYLEVLVRHAMVKADASGGKVSYHITPKGMALLRSFMETEEAAAELELDRLDATLFAKASSRGPKMGAMSAAIEGVRLALGKEGYRPAPGVRRGVSGVEHSFDLVMANGRGSTLGYITSQKGQVGDVIRAFILQTDCEIQVRVLCAADPGPEARSLATVYNIALVQRGAGS